MLPSHLQPVGCGCADAAGCATGAACVGAERVNHETMEKFAEALSATGFNRNAFVACYGIHRF